MATLMCAVGSISLQVGWQEFCALLSSLALLLAPADCTRDVHAGRCPSPKA